MNPDISDSSRRAVAFFRWLLRFYPAAFRREYEEKLILLFKDQLRDAKARRTTGAMVRFWSRMLADTGRAAGREHWNELTRLIASGSPSALLLHYFSSPGRGFCWACLACILVSIGVNLLTPVSYQSYAILGLSSYSDSTMDYSPRLMTIARQLSDDATLRGVAGLHRSETSASATQSELASVRRHLQVRIPKNTLYVWVFYSAPNAVEASEMLNRICDAYLVRRLQEREAGRQDVEIIDRAIPAIRPITPNLTGALVLGVFWGVVLGGPLALCLTWLRHRQRQLARA